MSACSKRYSNLPAFTALPIHDSYNYSVGRFKTSYLADQIHAYYRGLTNRPLAVATFVNIDDLYDSSTFGRMLSEQLMSELVMKGYNVIELRKSDALQILRGEGEFNLTQDTARLKNYQELAGVIVGTYIRSPVRVYLNARILDPRSSTILSAGSVEMAMTAEIDSLMRRGSFPQSMERIPVRHLGYAQYPLPYYYSPFQQLNLDSSFSEDKYPDEPRTPSTDLPKPNREAPKAMLEPDA